MQKKLYLLLLMALAMSGCQQANPKTTASVQNNAPQSLRVVTTFLPIYWFTKAVSGDKAKVEILIPPGTEVHEYQATPTNVQAIAQADVLVKNGLGLEEFLENTVKNAGNSKLREIDASQGIQPLEAASLTDGDRHSGHNHESLKGNPHVWLDPVLAKKQVENIRDGLIAADPQNKATYQANASSYIQQLDKLDREFKQRLQPYRGCTYITFHDAYPYLTRRYQLKQVAVVQIPEDNFLPEDLQKTIAAVKQFKVKTLIGEPGVDNKLVQSLSKDLNLTVYSLSSMESGELEPNYYFIAMKNNLQTLEIACK